MDKAARSYLRYSDFVVKIVSALALFAMTIVSALDVTWRGLFGVSVAWAQEVCILIAMWVYFFAYALIAKRHEYIRVELLFGVMPPAMQKVVALFCRLCVLAFFILVFGFAVKQVGFLSLFRTSVLEVPEYLMVLPIVFGAADIVLTELIFLSFQLRGEPEPGAQQAHALPEDGGLA